MITLNEQQQKIHDQAIKWFYHSSEQTFSIGGLAGTGKSTLLASIIKDLHLKQSDVLPMSFTGQAAIILRTKGFPNAVTCHSGLFTPVEEIVKDEFGKIVMNPQFNVPLIKWKFIPKDFSNSSLKLIVIDEAYMVPKKFRKLIDDTGIKVIATGDQGQLPPVGAEPGYLTGEPNTFYLTELMRQAENSPIVYLAYRARNGYPIEPGLYGNDVLVIFDDELDNDIIARSNIVLCGKNATREFINQRVRHEILGIRTKFPNYGERIICRKNSWDIEIDGIALVNGLTGSVVSPPDIGTFSGEIMKLDFLPDLLARPFQHLDVNYKYLNASHEEKEKLKMNPFLQGERFEYAYASTVHLAQGSEYNSGTYIEEYMRADLQNALNYTAITRFKQKMVYVKYRPKFWTF